MGTITTSATAVRAVDRLSAGERAHLQNVAASFAMEQLPLSDAMHDVLARYSLGEISAHECDSLLDELG